MGRLFFPPEASTHAGRVDALFGALLGLSAFITLLIAAAIVYFLIRYRRRSPGEVGAHITGHGPTELYLVILLLGLSLGAFYWASRLYLDFSTPPPDALDIYVVARQWMWQFQHPEGQAEIDQLHVPVGRDVKLTMTSRDVIHSFYVPAFRVKTDVLPGRYMTIWFRPTEPGTYHLFCAEYCGLEHSRMRGEVVALPPGDYATWLTEQAAQSPASAGQKLFQQLGCNECHRSDTLRRAPVLEGLYDRPVRLQNGEMTLADENYIRESILDPTAKVVEGFQPIMPSFRGQISEEELFQLLAYIKSIGSTPSAGGPEGPAPAAPAGGAGP